MSDAPADDDAHERIDRLMRELEEHEVNHPLGPPFVTSPRCSVTFMVAAPAALGMACACVKVDESAAWRSTLERADSRLGQDMLKAGVGVVIDYVVGHAARTDDPAAVAGALLADPEFGELLEPVPPTGPGDEAWLRENMLFELRTRHVIVDPLVATALALAIERAGAAFEFKVMDWMQAPRPPRPEDEP